MSGTKRWLSSVYFTDNNIGWIAGIEGTILHTINGGIPVELTVFTVEVFDVKVELTWSTATETNNQGFEILRSAQNDNDVWNKIGFVPGHGTTTETQHYSFTDNDVSSGKYKYKLKQIDYNGTFEYSHIVEVEVPFVNKFSLSQNYPNPFNPVTKISWQSPTGSWQSLKIYDVLGNEIISLLNEYRPAGKYEIEFDGSKLTSGIYFYQLRTEKYVEVKKMVLLK
jgi:hypothetical protein